MASRTLSRALLILALIVAAHAFKPISSKSVVEQLLGAAESLSFVLPDFAEVRIAQASYLAAAFAQGDRTDSADSRGTVMAPAAIGFEQIRYRATSCPSREIGPVLAKARPARIQLAKHTRPKQFIPELPEPMPLSQALAMTIQLHEVELRIIPVSRTSERQLLRRALFMPASMRPMLPVRKQAKVDCEATSIAASEWESELTTGGPREEEEFEFDLWDFTAPIETAEGIDSEPIAATIPRNCPVALPEGSVPPLPLESIPPK